MGDTIDGPACAIQSLAPSNSRCAPASGPAQPQQAIPASMWARDDRLSIAPSVAK